MKASEAARQTTIKARSGMMDDARDWLERGGKARILFDIEEAAKKGKFVCSPRCLNGASEYRLKAAREWLVNEGFATSMGLEEGFFCSFYSTLIIEWPSE